jgi:hypothetical protein
MRVVFPLLRVIFFVLLIAAFGRPVTGCTKTNNNHNDSTDTALRVIHHDSSKYYVTMDMSISNSSNIYADTFYDGATMIIYVVDGVVKVPGDSILNEQPFVNPESGSSGSWSATWIPDKIGEVNIVSALGIVLQDTTVVMTLNESGAVSPKWSVSFMGGAPTVGGGDPSPGWPLAFSFSRLQQSQDAFKLEQPGSSWTIWVYKDY